MKALQQLALVAAAASSFANFSASDDFNAGPSGDNGREGFVHNFNRPGNPHSGPIANGDANSAAYWTSINGSGALAIDEAAQGNNDWWQAPSRFLVNGGNFLGLTSGVLTMDYFRISPATVVAANRDTKPLAVRLYNSNGDWIEYRYQRSDQTTPNQPTLPANFFDTVNVATPLSFNVKDITNWDFSLNPADNPATPTVNERQATQAQFEGVMGSVVAMYIEGEVVSGAEVNAVDNILFTYDAGSGTQSESANFNAGPVAFDNGRAGWTHNRNRPGDNYPGFFAGDERGRVFYEIISYQDLTQGFITSGVLSSFDGTQGSSDDMVAPARYIPYGGRLDMVQTGSFKFDYIRQTPTGNITTNAIVLELRFISGPTQVRRTFSVAELNAMPQWPGIQFFNATGISRTWPFEVDLTDKTRFTTTTASGQVARSMEEALANVDFIIVDGEIHNGAERNSIDNVVMTATKRFEFKGTFTILGERQNPPAGVTLEYRTPGTQDVVERVWAKIQWPSGEFIAPQPKIPGTYDVSVAFAPTFLRRTIAGVHMTGTGDVTGMNFAVRNGNAANTDQEISPADFSAVLAAFGTEFDPNNLGNGYSALADINNDREVGPSDFSIVLAGFGEEGDQ